MALGFSSYVTALPRILKFYAILIVWMLQVAIAWYIAHIRYYKPKQDTEEEEEEKDSGGGSEADQRGITFLLIYW